MSNVFITVGTTRFDALTDLITTEECCNYLHEIGKFDSLTIQIGNSSKEPNMEQLKQFFSSVEVFRFKPDIASYMKKADLIISHGGSGTIFECLHLSKPLLVVVNETLADNHQFEIADKLQEEGNLLRTTVKELPSLLSKAETYAALKSLKPLPKANPEAFAKLVVEEMNIL